MREPKVGPAALPLHASPREAVAAPRTPELDEAALLARLRAGDAAAFSALVQRHHGSLLRVAMGFVSSAAVAEEVVQESWMAVITGLDGFEARASFRTWLFTILVNRAKTRGQREKRLVPFSSLGKADADEPEPAPERFRVDGSWESPPRSWGADSPEELLLRDEMVLVLEQAVSALPERYRIVITLRDIEELSAEDVCRMLGITEQNQRVLLHRARARLKELVEAHLLDGA